VVSRPANLAVRVRPHTDTIGAGSPGRIIFPPGLPATGKQAPKHQQSEIEEATMERQLPTPGTANLCENQEQLHTNRPSMLIMSAVNISCIEQLR
jgi:hypothetical protein